MVPDDQLGFPGGPSPPSRISIAALPPDELIVGVGDPFPSLAAVDDSGRTVNSASWQGGQILLKIFRGSW